jgi:hypothetical protein
VLTSGAEVRVLLGEVEAHLDKLNTSQITDLAVDIQRTFQPDWFGVEVNQFQELLAEQIWRRCADCGLEMPIYTLTNTVNK